MLRRAVAARLTAWRGRPPGGPVVAPPAISEELVRCARCGVRVPSSRAVTAAAGEATLGRTQGAGPWCSAACRDAALPAAPPGGAA